MRIIRTARDFVAHKIVKYYFPISEQAAQIAEKTILMLNSPELPGRGSGVLVGPNTALTAAHVADHLRGHSAFVHRPYSREKAAINDIFCFPYTDLAYVTFGASLIEPYAKIDDVTEIKNFGLQEKTTLIMPEFFVAPDSTPKFVKIWEPMPINTELSEHYFVSRTKKGVVLNAELSEKDSSLKILRSGAFIALMRSRGGNSGTGIFSNAGGLLTIVTGRLGFYRSSGPSVSVFRKSLKNLGIPSLSAG